MPYEDQIEFDVGITYFNVEVLSVSADNPADGEIMAPFVYDIQAYKLAEGPVQTDPPSLGDKLDQRLRLKNGQGAHFRFPCGDYSWLIFATKIYTWEGDPWDYATKTCMTHSGNLAPETWVTGYLKFHLKTS